MPNILTQIRDIFKNLSTSQKIFFVSVILIVFAGLVGLVMWANTPQYAVLFSNLNDEDASLIMQKLKDMKVKYRLSGNVIKVPEDKVNELRINLAAMGLPKGGGVGFEVFDKSKLGMTEFMEKINYLRALEGELSRTISSIREVKSAKVHLVLPKKSVFLEEREPAKASIILNVYPGTVLSKSVIGAIVHLVSSAVEGLTPENVTIVDVYGRLLASSDSSNPDVKLNSRQIEIKEKVSREMEKKIVALLEPIVGIGKVRASVVADLDFTKKEKVDEIYDPNGQVERSEKTETQKSTEGVQGGTPGVGSNVAGNTTQTNSGIVKTKEIKKDVKNYEINKTVLKTVFPSGEIKKLSVSVIVDDAVKLEKKGKEVVEKKVPRTPQELDKIKKLVAAAVGINKNRGDTLEVANLSFDETYKIESEKYMKTQEKKKLITTAMKYGIILLLALLLIFLVLKPMVKKVTAEVEKQKSSLPAGGIAVGEIEEEAPPKLDAAEERKQLEKEIESQYKPPKEAKKIEIIREKLQSFATENTDDLVAIIRSMLLEE